MVREVGFDDVFDSQAAFRALLDTLSRPGKVRRLPACAYTGAPEGFCSPSLTIMKTLCDHRVSFSLVPREPALERYLEVNLATPCEGVETADYVIFSGAAFHEEFLMLKRGLPEFPESSATALLCVGNLFEGALDPAFDKAAPSCRLVLTGPGVQEKAFLTVAGFDPRYGEARARTNNISPMGIDLFLVDAGGRVAGIPRTTVVEIS
jgi:alpha-D-ribose 1-methylphosphonate 5-triphosphate synthase subunit PhnH